MIVTNYAIRLRVAVFVLAIVLVIVGMVNYASLPREGSPDITIPYVFITSVHEGTAPTEMERLVSIPLEKQLSDLENVKEVTAVSGDSYSSITVQFRGGSDIDAALQRVKNKVDLARPDLPEDLDEPVVQAINFSSDFPVLVLALSGDTDLERLRRLAENLQEEIELLPGVKAAEVTGGREREVRVEVDVHRLAAYRIPLPLVLSRIGAENRTISAGHIEGTSGKFQVRVPGEYALAAQMRDLVVAEHAGAPVYLRDIASIRDTHKDVSTISRVNGAPAMSLSVKKRSGENTVRLIARVRTVLDGFLLPPGIELTTVMDESENIDMMISDLENNVVSGFLLVVVVLFIFMGLRNSLFVAIAIPLSMLIAFSAMGAMGFTLNMLVLFALVLAVGMLVDNAIVVVENVYRHRTQGETRREAARKGAAEVAWPVITSTLTTLAAFSPLLFWPDIVGQFMSILPKTLIVVLTASLFVAVVINPAICSLLIGGQKRRLHPGEGAGESHPFVHGYEQLLRVALKHRGPVLFLGVAFLFFSIAVYGRFGQGVEYFPEIPPRYCTVEVKYAQGTDIARVDAVLREIEGKVAAYKDVEFYLATAGVGAGGGFLGSGTGTHLGNVHVQFHKLHERSSNTLDLVKSLREEIGAIPGAQVKVERQQEGPPRAAPVSVEIAGSDYGVLEDLADAVVDRIRPVKGLVDLQHDYERAVPELQFHVDRKRAARFGLDTAAIGMFLRTAIYGMESSKYRVDEEEFDITVRLPVGQRQSTALLSEVFVPVSGGGSVPLTSLGTLTYTGGQGAITRKDQKRVITVTGSNANRGVDRILEDIRQQLKGLELPQGYVITFTGDQEDMDEASAFLSKSLLVALGLILVVLVIQFNSVLCPFIIMMSVVLSLVGVMWGLLLCRMRFGVIMTGVGVISLAGIVVNNAIVLIDCIRQREREGVPATEAIVIGGRLRLRPVLLTAVTTILGLIPMAVGWSLEFRSWPPRLVSGAESSAWWAPMAIAVIFGLGVSTLLTLVLVPVMYSLADSVSTWFRGRLQLEE